MIALGRARAVLWPLPLLVVFIATVRRTAAEDTSRNDAIESLYVFDAVNSRDYAYNLAGGTTAIPVRLTAAGRLEHQRLIREPIDQIAAFFHFDAQPSR